MVVAEICARLRREGSLTGRFIGGVIYRAYALPVRDPDAPPSPPVFATRSDADLRSPPGPNPDPRRVPSITTLARPSGLGACAPAVART